MYKKLLDFIKYNNAFTVIVVMLFFGSGVSLAASTGLGDSVYSSQETLIAVDNRLLLNTDIDNFNFNLKINSIKDDAKNYYATYSYQTLAIKNGVWQNQNIEKTLTINKEALAGKDLGLYLAKELGDNINYELSSLKRVQKLEREKGESQKVVSIEYSGLIGKLLDPKEKVIDGYNPVIPEPVLEVPATVELTPEEVIVSTPHIKPIDNNTATQSGSGAVVDEKLIQDVVDKLLPGEATSTPTVDATTTPGTNSTSVTVPRVVTPEPVSEQSPITTPEPVNTSEPTP